MLAMLSLRLILIILASFGERFTSSQEASGPTASPVLATSSGTVVDIPCLASCLLHTDQLRITCPVQSRVPPPNTQLLQLDENLLWSRPSQALERQNNITSLHLKGCGHTNFQEAAFQGLQHLHYLYMSNLSLGNLRDGIFDGLGHLSFLDLDNNRIANITPGIFLPLKNLAGLHLRDNLLTTLHDDMFQGLSQLRWLYLNHNRISQISQDAFQAPSKLRRLYLEGNGLTSVPWNAINKVKLSILHLGSNRIHNISNVDFRKLRFLRELKLDKTELENVGPNTFVSLRRLRSLDLSKNNLSTLPSLSQLPALQRLHLEGNPWLCDCRLTWLHTWVQEEDSEPVTCQSPPSLTGQRLGRTKIQYLTCPPYMTPTTSSKSTNAPSVPRPKSHPSSTVHPTHHKATRTSERAPKSKMQAQPTAKPYSVKDNTDPIPDPCWSRFIRKVTISNTSRNSFSVAWEPANGLPEAAYEVRVETHGERTVTEALGGVTKLKIPNLKSGTTYEACVIPTSIKVGYCPKPATSQCSSGKTSAGPSNAEAMKGFSKTSQATVALVIVAVVLLAIAVFVVNRKRQRSIMFQRHHDDDSFMEEPYQGMHKDADQELITTIENTSLSIPSINPPNTQDSGDLGIEKLAISVPSYVTKDSSLPGSLPGLDHK
uniref:chondroadherin-like protein n=1 Tax=Myxine glutinosa TaxID=7769 RepID=UPI00358EED62